MSKLSKYNKNLDYSYALGIFPSIEAIKNSPNSCLRLLKSNNINGEGFELLEELCKNNNIRTEYAPNILDRISPKENTFAAMVIKKQQLELNNNTNHIVLYNVMDSGNLGTIMRTMLGFKIQDLAIIKPATDVFDPRTIRASMGALFSLRVTEFNSLEEYIKKYENRNIFLFMLDGSENINDIKKHQDNKPYTLIFGNEGSGLNPEFKKYGIPVRIDHSNKIDSLNLSIAAGIGMYKFNEIMGE